jgi:prolyl-tRNA synthetase
MTDIFDQNGVEEVAFPLLIPESLFNKEKEHIDGFAPEVLTVTRVGEKKFEDPLLIRPTSEVLFGKYFQETLVSYKQLPVVLNQ